MFTIPQRVMAPKSGGTEISLVGGEKGYVREAWIDRARSTTRTRHGQLIPGFGVTFESQPHFILHNDTIACQDGDSTKLPTSEASCCLFSMSEGQTRSVGWQDECHVQHALISPVARGEMANDARPDRMETFFKIIVGDSHRLY